MSGGPRLGTTRRDFAYAPGVLSGEAPTGWYFYGAGDSVGSAQSPTLTTSHRFHPVTLLDVLDDEGVGSSGWPNVPMARPGVEEVSMSDARAVRRPNDSADTDRVGPVAPTGAWW